MTKAVIFDCFGVLYGGSLQAQLNICPPGKHQELIDNNKQNDYGYLSLEDYTANVAGIIGITPDAVSQMFRQKRVRNQAMFEYIKNLRQRGVRVGLLTNAGRDMPGVLFTEDELSGGIFDAYIVSSQLGLAKPNPVIYQTMAQELGLKPQDCIMVDDTRDNCTGAEVAGMQSVWYTDTTTAVGRVEQLLITD